MLLSPSESLPPPLSYRAPAADGGLLCIPPWADLPRLAASGGTPHDSSARVGGSTLAEFRRDARRELVDLAKRYTGEYADVEFAGDPAAPLVVAGHQPELIHPGVWLKNFAASELAASLGGGAINLVIDSDASHGHSIRVPGGAPEAPRYDHVPFDAPGPATAWEERRIGDSALWKSFGARATAAMNAWGVAPLIHDWWPTVLQHARPAPGLAFAKARHELELSWGVRTLELPQSQVCRSQSFRCFASGIVARLPEFSAAYNDALAAFRRRHKIRNHAHPAPNLAQGDGWWEAPFWIWSKSDPVRRAVFARPIAGGWEVTDRRELTLALPVPAEDQFEDAVAAMGQWEERGVKLRSRALATTLFARLALADLFIHGIGGARYDEATDAICQRFFGVMPAPYAALSGTLRLPIAFHADGHDRVAQAQRRLRELRFHPERFLAQAELTPASASQARMHAAQKQQWLATAKTTANAAERHQAIEQANAALAELLATQWRETEADLAAARADQRAAAVLGSREYAFCLYPPATLRQFALDFPRRMA